MNARGMSGLKIGNKITDVVYPNSSTWHSEAGRESIDAHLKLADPLILMIIVKHIDLTGSRAEKLRFESEMIANINRI